MAQYNLREIPDKLYKDFKTACAHYGINVRETLMNHMKAVIWDYQHRLDDPSKLNIYKRKGGKNK